MEDPFSVTADALEAADEPAGPGRGTSAGAVPPDPPVPPLPPVGPAVTVVRRDGRGWRVGDEELPDLTSAMVLADLLAADHPGTAPSPDTSPSPNTAASPQTASPPDTAARLRVTVAQLEAALVRRVRVEQAIGIICERRRVAPRRAFELLRAQARGSGARVADLAAQVVDSATNPLLILPEELARPQQQPRTRGRSPRHMRLGG